MPPPARCSPGSAHRFVLIADHIECTEGNENNPMARGSQGLRHPAFRGRPPVLPLPIIIRELTEHRLSVSIWSRYVSREPRVWAGLPTAHQLRQQLLEKGNRNRGMIKRQSQGHGHHGFQLDTCSQILRQQGCRLQGRGGGFWIGINHVHFELPALGLFGSLARLPWFFGPRRARCVVFISPPQIVAPHKRNKRHINGG